MWLKQRHKEAEIFDDFDLRGKDVDRNLYELAWVNKYMGTNRLVKRGLRKLLKDGKLKDGFSLADLGCGGGDVLEVIRDWSERKGMTSTLSGIDANPYIIDYATARCNGNIHFEATDFTSDAFRERSFDVILCSQVCHHFTDVKLVKLLKQLKKQAREAILINELHRHPLSYYPVKYFTKWFSQCEMVKNDAPLSVAKGFRRSELNQIIEAAGFRDYEVEWHLPFRWQVLLKRST